MSEIQCLIYLTFTTSTNLENCFLFYGEKDFHSINDLLFMSNKFSSIEDKRDTTIELSINIHFYTLLFTNYDAFQPCLWISSVGFI
jgi:hypothetical protein